MKRIVCLCLLLVPLVWACATTPAKPGSQVSWDYEKDAIEFHFKADNQLNYKDKKAHALVVCVYQLMNPNAFNQLSGNQQGLYDLLECQVFDQASVAGSKQVVVNPGKNIDMKLDRAEGAKYVALVAGYYAGIEKNKITRLYAIPEVKVRTGFLKLKKVAKPGKLDVTVSLGSKQIQEPVQAKGKK